MFPTRFKGRISHKLSYPVTAKEISDALADVPQAERLTIDFYGTWRHLLHSKRPHLLTMVSFETGRQYPVLEISFAFQGKKLPDAGVTFEKLVYCIAQYARHGPNGNLPSTLKQQALPAMRRWLLERSTLSSSHGIQTLIAIYDERQQSLRLEHFQSPGETFQSDP